MIDTTRRCVCGCKTLLPRYASQYATRDCYREAMIAGSKSTHRSDVPKSGSAVWRWRSKELRQLLTDLGPTKRSELDQQCRRQFGWTANVTTNVLAWSHPLVLERRGVWALGGQAERTGGTETGDLVSGVTWAHGEAESDSGGDSERQRESK